MSKAATAMMTDTLRLELAPFGIKVIALKTGTVKSKFYKNQTRGNSGYAARGVDLHAGKGGGGEQYAWWYDYPNDGGDDDLGGASCWGSVGS